MAKNIDTAKNFIEAATNIVQALGEVNPRDDEFDYLINKHERLCRAAMQYMDLQERIGYFLGEMAEIENGGDVEIPVSKITPIKPKKTRAKTEPATEPESEVAPTEEEPAPIADEVEKPIEFATVEEEKPASEPAAAALPDTPIALADIKAAFIEAARSGIKVAEIIADTGYSKLSDVPAELYGALMRALERKKNGAE